jgi:hypothetical protein
MWESYTPQGLTGTFEVRKGWEMPKKVRKKTGEIEKMRVNVIECYY